MKAEPNRLIPLKSIENLLELLIVLSLCDTFLQTKRVLGACFAGSFLSCQLSSKVRSFYFTRTVAWL